MTTYSDDLTNVPGAGELVPEGQYSFRVSKVDEKVSDDDGSVSFGVQCKIQTEGPAFGETVFLNVGLKDFGLRVLKSLYVAIGYKPGPEGHDPQRLVDGEFKGTVVHKVYQGNTYANIAPASIKSVV